MTAQSIVPLREIAITGRVAVSCLGRGSEVHARAFREGRTGLIPCDYPDVTVPCFIGRVAGLETAQIPKNLAAYTNRATQLAVLAMGTDTFGERIARAARLWGRKRLGLVLGTSTSGVERLEQVYRARKGDAPLATDYQIYNHNDHHAVTMFLVELLGIEGPAFTVSTACSSSAKAIVDAAQLIQLGICDAVLAGGIDSLCLTSLYGFDALELLSSTPCRPFDANRDGLSIGEGAGFVLLERDGNGPWLSGYGESSDATTMSTPPPDGAGAALAMRRALTRAGLAAEEIGFVKLHGTATRANDTAEGAAVAEVFPSTTPAASLKGMIGHTLGAAGTLEAVLCLDAMEIGYFPGTIGLKAPDPAVALRPRMIGEAHEAGHVVCNSFGFGGSNCTLVLSRE